MPRRPLSQDKTSIYEIRALMCQWRTGGSESQLKTRGAIHLPTMGASIRCLMMTDVETRWLVMRGAICCPRTQTATRRLMTRGTMLQMDAAMRGLKHPERNTRMYGKKRS